jgi:aryl-alcohol dehydrogenase-like predicted oxidoreductase
MKYKNLGLSDIKVSEIGFGCMSLGEDEKYNVNLLSKALDAGINFFDTADLYQAGRNEMTVGKAFSEKRDKVIISTKVGNQLRADGSGWDWNPGRDYILKAAEESLKRLKTDYIDLYLLHGGTIDDPIDETIQAFEILKRDGKIRTYGISSIRPNVIREYVKKSSICSVMMQYSLLDRRPEESCLDLLKENNISVLTRGALAKGLLINKPPQTYLKYSSGEVENLTTEIKKVCHGIIPSESAALGFVLAHPAVSSAVTGIRNEQQLSELIKASHQLPVKNEILSHLKAISPVSYYDTHR